MFMLEQCWQILSDGNAQGKRANAVQGLVDPRSVDSA